MDLRELCESIDVVEFFGQFTELKQNGREWWGLTPFQAEKTPSFSVDPEHHVFYCFSTGYGGDVIEFIKRYYQCSTKEAIEKLKAYCGVNGIQTELNKRLPATSICKKYQRKSLTGKQNTSKPLPESCMDLYIKGENLEVWMDEGISRDVLEKFQVRYDPFANRLVYPIRNLHGEIVNIGGRTLDEKWKEKGLRKYNYYYNWGTINIIYGLYENKAEIMGAKNVILFEGVKSVMLANTWGIDNCGAILTSHLGPNQMKSLLAFCSRNRVSVTFALDKEIDIRKDKHIMQLRQFLNVYYLWDYGDLLPDVKMAPVDMGEEVFRTLLSQKLRL